MAANPPRASRNNLLAGLFAGLATGSRVRAKWIIRLRPQTRANTLTLIRLLRASGLSSGLSSGIKESVSALARARNAQVVRAIESLLPNEAAPQGPHLRSTFGLAIRRKASQGERRQA